MRDLSDAAELLAMDRVRKLIDRWRDQLNDMPAGLLRIQMENCLRELLRTVDA